MQTDRMREIEMNISWIAALAQRLIVVGVVCLIAWHVTHFGRAPRGRATVYVPQPNDVVTIDDQVYVVESSERPLVCDLESGKHVLHIKRGQLTIIEEEFTIEPEKERILAPQDRAKVVMRKTPPKTDIEAVSTTGLAIRTMRSQPTPDRAWAAPAR